MRNIKKKKLIH